MLGDGGRTNAPQDTTTTTTTTMKKEHPFFTPNMMKGTNPTPGKTYIITDKTYEHMVSLRNGQVKGISLAKANLHPGMGGRYLWHCEEKNGWIRFRNAGNGEYLGPNCFYCGNAVLVTAKEPDNGYRQFSPSLSERVGWVSLILWAKSLFELGDEGIDGGMTRNLFTNNGVEPTVWEFVEVPFDP